MKKAMSSLISLLFLIPASHAQEVGDSLGIFDSERAIYEATIVATDFERPWGMVFLPDGRALVTDRVPSDIKLLDVNTGEVTPLKGVPKTYTIFDTGMKDITLHPDFSENGWIYFSYSTGDETATTLKVDRARLAGTQLVDRENIFTATPMEDSLEHYWHYGARLLFHNGYLFVSVGDRSNPQRAQDLGAHNGSILRLHDDGSVPADNPFTGVEGALPEIWSYGNRHSQGFAFHPETGDLWAHEHGPLGGDELNVILPGRNYGWPVITYGLEYSGEPVGDGLTHYEGMEQPRYYWPKTIAPSGMIFYTGESFPGWQNNLLMGSLSQMHIRRLIIENDRVIGEERLLEGIEQRIRFIIQGPDGDLYVGAGFNLIMRLSPIEQ